MDAHIHKNKKAYSHNFRKLHKENYNYLKSINIPDLKLETTFHLASNKSFINFLHSFKSPFILESPLNYTYKDDLLFKFPLFTTNKFH